MRIPLNCMRCFVERGEPSDVFYLAELQDDGVYYMVCPYGHESATCVQEQKFEILFELAANAIVDGYYREAVSSFSSSYERFAEFYIKVISRSHRICPNRFSDAWKKISSQSERQLGAYIFVYLIENGVAPPLLESRHAAFRNAVIHKGRLPTRDQAVGYGSAVLDCTAPVLQELKQSHSDHVGAIVSEHVRDTTAQVKHRQNISFMSVPTTLSIARAASVPQPSLVDTLVRLEKVRGNHR